MKINDIVPILTLIKISRTKLIISEMFARNQRSYLNNYEMVI